MNVSQLSKLVHDFLQHLEECGKSKKTVENYRHYLLRFVTYYKEKKRLTITNKILEEYRTWLGSQRFTPHGDTHLDLTTQNYHVSALRSFLKFCIRQKSFVVDIKKVTLHAVTRVPRTVSLSEGDVANLFESIVLRDIKSLRDKAILYTLISTDMRVSELCAINTAMLTHDCTQFEVRQKNGLIKEYFLSIDARNSLRDYFAIRQDASEALFVNNGKRVSKSGETRLTPRSIERIVKQYSERAGIQKRVTPHTLRISSETR